MVVLSHMVDIGHNNASNLRKTLVMWTALHYYIMKMNLLEYDMLSQLLQWEPVHQLHEICVDKIQSEMMSTFNPSVCVCVYMHVHASVRSRIHNIKNYGLLVRYTCQY